MKAICLIGLMLAGVLFSGAAHALHQHALAKRAVLRVGHCEGTTQPIMVVDSTPAGSPRPDPKQTPREQEAAAKLEREKIRLQIEANINRLKYCVAGNSGCAANDLPRLLLGLTRSEIEALLGPPQYRLHLAPNDHYYWTVPLSSRGTVSATRVRVIFGDCYYREKNSRKKGVCEAQVY